MRVAILGCGEIGALRAAALSKVPELRLAAVCDTDAQRAHKLSSHLGVASEADWHSLVRRDDTDAVFVCTPPHLHEEMCVAALRAGKHVLCEKPLGRSATECHRMVQAAQDENRFLATGFNYRFYPSVRMSRVWLESGAIGSLVSIQSYAGYSAADHSHDWIHDASVMGGGALRDNGIHLIDLTRYFLGEVKEASGFSQNLTWNYPGCEDHAFLLLQGPNARIASVQASWNEWRGYRFFLELFGDSGCIRVSCFPMIAEMSSRKRPGGRRRRKIRFFPWTHLMEHVRSYRWVVHQSFVAELRDFVKAVRGQPAEIASGFDGLRAVEIAEAARPC